MVTKVTQGDHPRTDATIDELMDRHLAEAKLSRKTRPTYLGYHRKHIAPLLGKFKINGALDPELLDVFYAELARCRDHCTGKPTVKHGPTGHTRARTAADGTSAGRSVTGPSARSTGCSTAPTSVPCGGSGR